MQNRLIPVALVALTGVAYAVPPPSEMPELPANAPPRCVELLHSRPGLAARIAAGNCLARESLKLVPVTTANLETANALASAVAPGIAFMDDVIAQGDPYFSLLAEDAKRDVYEGMSVRLRRAVQPDDKVARVQAEMLVANWLDNVALATVRITEIADNHPDVADRDQVVTAIMQRANAQEATQIATRSRR